MFLLSCRWVSSVMFLLSCREVSSGMFLLSCRWVVLLILASIKGDEQIQVVGPGGTPQGGGGHPSETETRYFFMGCLLTVTTLKINYLSNPQGMKNAKSCREQKIIPFKNQPFRDIF